MHTGSGQVLTEGTTPVAKHMVEDHNPGDVTINIIDHEQNWWKRGVKEAFHIQEVNPTLLNEDGGRFHIPPIYNLIKRCPRNNSTVSRQKKDGESRNLREQGTTNQIQQQQNL